MSQDKDRAREQLAYYLEQQRLFNAGIIKPRHIVGTGYRTSAIARRLAVEFLKDTIAEYQSIIEKE